ncbi:phospholipid/cholesterol/gamma-HCH transport system substrate-binding protein [Herbihabitans rhizosphaerae]|uniref:Phospholipid/cholesterol/gamma-HCH transport system substrate-binding protein n=1 Tax=Herbihabitans rhizosphaerae TaxID=1872711 RepID=A0A4Q7KPK4_9PSEU|nr:MCE family protein [Herbihabitans rhizosphaerae]RZS37202.1 phospholipid/cholesterol/gamma-HCH transport system substrate-binding protein [Herbihabitans rhizosphaerae]
MTRKGTRKGIRLKLAGLAAATMLLSGCGFTGIYDLPLPGGADLGDHPYSVKVQFRDVLDLVPQSGVKVNEVAIGRVDKIGLAEDGWTAEATLLVNGDVNLPANAVARVRQSSLLGEKFIELAPPNNGTPGVGRLSDGAVIKLDRTSRNTEIEEVLGALSMLLNGGGLEQLQTISKELTAATEGRATDIKATLNNVNTMARTLDASKGSITKALDGLNKLSGTLNGQKDKAVAVIDNIGPGIKTLTDQRGQLVTMLQSLQSLSGVAIDTVNRSQEDLIADLKSLTPALRKLAEAGGNLPKALELLFTLPFPDGAMDAVRGDYFNLFLDVDLKLQDIIDNLSRSRQNPLRDIPGLGPIIAGPQQGVPGNAPPPLPLPSLGGPSNSYGNDPLPIPSLGGTSPQSSGHAGIMNALTGRGA